MHAVDLLDEALFLAARLGFVVRQEYLGGTGGGRCEFGGRRWIFVDLALSVPEQLEQVLEALSGNSLPAGLPLSKPLRECFERRSAA